MRSGFQNSLLRSTSAACNNSRTLGKIFRPVYRLCNRNRSSLYIRQSPARALDSSPRSSLPLYSVWDEPSWTWVFLSTSPLTKTYRHSDRMHMKRESIQSLVSGVRLRPLSNTLHRTSLLRKLSPIDLSCWLPVFWIDIPTISHDEAPLFVKVMNKTWSIKYDHSDLFKSTPTSYSMWDASH